jgi:hypothetical protein
MNNMNNMYRRFNQPNSYLDNPQQDYDNAMAASTSAMDSNLFSPFNSFSPYSPMNILNPLSPVSPYSPVSQNIPTSPYYQNMYSPMSPITTSSVFMNQQPSYNQNDALIDSPVLSSVNLTYTAPAVGMYENLNADPELRNRMIKHFYFFKTLGEWLSDDMIELLSYFVEKDGKISLIKNVKDYKESSAEKDSEKITKKKIEYIKENVFKKSDMKHLLTKFVKQTKINWYDLPHQDSVVQKAIKRTIDKAIRDKIE